MDSSSSSSPSSSLATLPNEMLDIILNKSGSFSLAERISLRAVSHLFQDIIENSLQLEASLVIRVGNTAGIHPKPGQLVVSVKNFKKTKFIQLFTRLFPKTTKLTIHTGSIVAWRLVPHFLSPFLSQLQTVKLCGSRICFPPDNDTGIPTDSQLAHFEALSQSFNSMSALSSLHLNFISLYFSRCFLPRIGPTLARLQRFTLPNYPIFSPDKSIATFVAKSLSSRCSQLILSGNLLNSSDDLPIDHLAATLTHLQLNLGPIDSNSTIQNSMLRFISRFHRLTNLSLSNIENLDALLPGLRPLSQLTHLKLKISNKLAPIPSPSSPTLALFAIQHFTLQLYFYPHLVDSFDVLNLLSNIVSWFPNISYFTFCCEQRHHSRIRANLPQVPFTVNILNLNELPRFGW